MSELKVIEIRKARPKVDAVSLTEARVAAAKPRVVRWVLADAKVRGLVVRIEPSGVKSWFARGRIGSGRGAPWAEIRIGDATQVPLAAARTDGARLLAEMRAGRDPRKPVPGMMPVGGLVEAYAARLQARGVVQAVEIEAALRRHLKGLWKRPLGEVTRFDVAAIVDKLEARGLPGAATNARKFIHAMMTWAVDAGHLVASPLAGWRRERSTRAQALARPKRALTTAGELKAFWTATEAAHDPIFGLLLRLLLVTGARRGEVGGMTWGEVDLDASVWSIPASRRKMGDDYDVPLGPLAQAILAEVPRQHDSLVFPGRGGRPITGWGQRWAAVVEAFGAPLVIHDLRRSFRSSLSELKVEEAVSELMIGHRKRGLIAVYDRSERWPERVAAQGLSEQFLAKTVGAELAVGLT